MLVKRSMRSDYLHICHDLFPPASWLTDVPLLAWQLYKIDTERNLLYVKGHVPGPKGSFVRVRTGTFSLRDYLGRIHILGVHSEVDCAR